MKVDPTNAELLSAINAQGQSFRDHAEDDRQYQADQTKVNTNVAIFMAETEGKLDKLEHIPNKEEIGPIVVAAVNEYFKNKGKLTFSVIVGASVLVGAILIIAGGLKTALAWIGVDLIRHP